MTLEASIVTSVVCLEGERDSHFEWIPRVGLEWNRKCFMMLAVSPILFGSLMLWQYLMLKINISSSCLKSTHMITWLLPRWIVFPICFKSSGQRIILTSESHILTSSIIFFCYAYIIVQLNKQRKEKQAWVVKRRCFLTVCNSSAYTVSWRLQSPVIYGPCAGCWPICKALGLYFGGVPCNI